MANENIPSTSYMYTLIIIERTECDMWREPFKTAGFPQWLVSLAGEKGRQSVFVTYHWFLGNRGGGRKRNGFYTV